MFEHETDYCDCPGKWCPGCEQAKCWAAFNRNRSQKDGLQWYCRICQNAMNKEHYQNNLERERARSRTEEKRGYGRTWRRNNSEYMQKYNKAYSESHPEYMRGYREKNADKRREQARTYAQSHLKERAVREVKRRARKLQAGGTFTLREWEALCDYYDYTCLRCGRRKPDIELTVDHVIPLSVGGSNSIDNIQPLCRSCNASKQTKTIDYRKGWVSRN